jgi:hypothetical protein
VAAVFDVSDDLSSPTLVLTPIFTVSGGVADLRRGRNVPLEQWASASPPTEMPLALR